MKKKNPEAGQAPSDSDLDSNHKKISAVLRSHLDAGIELLSSITSEARKKHPLLVAGDERAQGREKKKNHNVSFKIFRVTGFHRTALQNAQDLLNFKEEIDKWSDECGESIKRVYPEVYYENFMKLKVVLDLPINKSINPKQAEELFADMQIKLKTQLENMLYFLVRRIVYLEEFGRTLIGLDLLIDDYTRKLLDVLAEKKLYEWCEIYPDYYDPLFKVPSDSGARRKGESQNADTDFIIEHVRSLIADPLRENFSFGLVAFTHDGRNATRETDLSKNICHKVQVVKDDFEREFIKSIGKKFPPKFMTQWEEKIIDIEQAYDLMSAINRLPIYLRDSMSISGNESEEYTAGLRNQKDVEFEPFALGDTNIKDLEIRCIGNSANLDSYIILSLPYKHGKRNYAQAGFRSRVDGSPVKAWEHLFTIVRKSGEPFRPKNRMMIKRLNKQLRKLLVVDFDPINPCGKGQYQVSFNKPVANP